MSSVCINDLIASVVTIAADLIGCQSQHSVLVTGSQRKSIHIEVGKVLENSVIGSLSYSSVEHFW